MIKYEVTITYNSGNEQVYTFCDNNYSRWATADLKDFICIGTFVALPHTIKYLRVIEIKK